MAKEMTWVDVQVEMTRAGVLRRDVAGAMGMSPQMFSRLIHSETRGPTDEWVARFRAALEALREARV